MSKEKVLFFPAFYHAAGITGGGKRGWENLEDNIHEETNPHKRYQLSSFFLFKFTRGVLPLIA
jgi:hypothetical protein